MSYDLSEEHAAVPDLTPSPAPESLVPESPPKVVIVSGSPRTGTTLLAEILNSSPDAGVMFEYGLGDLVRDMRRVHSYGLQHDEIRRLHLAVPLEARQTADTYTVIRPRTPARYPQGWRFPWIVAAVVEASLGKRGLTIIGSKTAGIESSGDTRLVAELFPDVSHLLTVRNPLGAVNSMLNRRNLARRGLDVWPIEEVDQAVAEYRRGIMTLLSRVARAPERSYVVKYEDYFDRFDEVVAAIARFLGVQLPVTSENRILGEPISRIILTPPEEDAVRTTFAAALASWDAKGLGGVHPGRTVSALADCLEPIVPGRRYVYEGAAQPRPFLGAGWSVSQPEGVWTDDVTADLFFPALLAKPYQLVFEGSFFLPQPNSAVTLVVEADDQEIFRGTCVLGEHPVAADPSQRFFRGPGPRILMTLPFVPSQTLTRISLRLSGATTPLAAGYSGDDRLLGFLLQRLMLRQP